MAAIPLEMTSVGVFKDGNLGPGLVGILYFNFESHFNKLCVCVRACTCVQMLCVHALLPERTPWMSEVSSLLL